MSHGSEWRKVAGKLRIINGSDQLPCSRRWHVGQILCGRLVSIHLIDDQIFTELNDGRSPDSVLVTGTAAKCAARGLRIT